MVCLSSDDLKSEEEYSLQLSRYAHCIRMSRHTASQAIGQAPSRALLNIPGAGGHSHIGNAHKGLFHCLRDFQAVEFQPPAPSYDFTECFAQRPALSEAQGAHSGRSRFLKNRPPDIAKAPVQPATFKVCDRSPALREGLAPYVAGRRQRYSLGDDENAILDTFQYGRRSFQYLRPVCVRPHRSHAAFCVLL